MDDTFHFEYPHSRKSQPIMLKDAIETLEKLEYTGLAASLKNYVKNRETYIKNHMGKFVQITEGKIQVIDNIPIDLKKYTGIVMEIGNEVENSNAACLYSITL